MPTWQWCGTTPGTAPQHTADPHIVYANPHRLSPMDTKATPKRPPSTWQMSAKIPPPTVRRRQCTHWYSGNTAHAPHTHQQVFQTCQYWLAHQLLALMSTQSPWTPRRMQSAETYRLNDDVETSSRRIATIHIMTCKTLEQQKKSFVMICIHTENWHTKKNILPQNQAQENTPIKTNTFSMVILSVYIHVLIRAVLKYLSSSLML